jgi:hypothetical protein
MEIINSLKAWFNKTSLYWAVNYPKAWSLGWFTQLVLTLVLCGASMLIAAILPMSLIDTPNVETWYALGYIPAVVWGIFIIYRLVKYNTDKLYGNRSLWHNFIELPTYILQFALPMLIPIAIGTVLTLRIDGLISDKELAAHKSAFEKAQPFFTFDYGSGQYQKDVYDYGNTEMFVYFENDAAFYAAVTTPLSASNRSYPDYEYSETGEAEAMAAAEAAVAAAAADAEALALQNDSKSYQDSINTYRNNMRDSIQMHAGVFQQVRPMLYPYYFDHFTQGEQDDASWLLNDKSEGCKTYYSQETDSLKRIYFYNNYKNKALIKQNVDAFLAHITAFGEPVAASGIASVSLIDLFDNHTYYAALNSSLSKEVTAFDKLTENYVDQLNYIQRCKNKDFDFLSNGNMYEAYLIFLIVLSIIFSLFKNLAWNEFLWGVFIITLILIITSVMMAIIRPGENFVYATFWIEFIVFFCWAMLEKQKQLRNRRGAVLLMIVHLVMAMFPFAVLGTLDEVFHMWHWAYFNKYMELRPTLYDANNMDYNEAYYELRDTVHWLALYGGYALYLLILYPLWLKKEWLAFMSKPKKA